MVRNMHPHRITIERNKEEGRFVGVGPLVVFLFFERRNE